MACSTSDPPNPSVACTRRRRSKSLGSFARFFKCTILADIGERALVAANSVVTRPVPAYCLAAGAPARTVEYFGPPELRPPGVDA